MRRQVIVAKSGTKEFNDVVEGMKDGLVQALKFLDKGGLRDDVLNLVVKLVLAGDEAGVDNVTVVLQGVKLQIVDALANYALAKIIEIVDREANANAN